MANLTWTKSIFIIMMSAIALINAQVNVDDDNSNTMMVGGHTFDFNQMGTSGVHEEITNDDAVVDDEDSPDVADQSDQNVNDDAVNLNNDDEGSDDEAIEVDGGDDESDMTIAGADASDSDDAPLKGRFTVLNAKGYSGRDEEEPRYRSSKSSQVHHRTPSMVSGRGGIPDGPVSNPMPTAPAAVPSFAQFDNATAMEDGNCLEAINQGRTSSGVAPLTSDATLVQMAAKHSAYMSATQTASHDGFWSDRFDAVPKNTSSVGEVVMYDDKMNAPNGNAKRAVDRWMASGEHKALLTRGDMTSAGCSVAEGQDGRFYVTAIVVSKSK